MNGLGRALAVAATVVASAVILFIAFAWFGPGLDRAAPSASATLFDEELVLDVYERVSPAVVDINVDEEVRGSFSRLGSGSGFVIDSEGHIVTNNHVVQQADRVRIRFHDGSSATAEILGSNPANDLAVLKVPSEAVSGIDPVSFADSDKVRPGQLAIAIGSPFGLDGSVTVGVISGTGRTLDSDISRLISGVLQTDALISPGNSGGPLLDREGKVLGINTAIRIAAESFFPAQLTQRSIGFAVPVNSLTRMLPDLKAGNVVRPPWLGISAMSLDSALIEDMGLEGIGLDPANAQGVYVTQVVPDSPAEEAGLIASGILSTGRAGAGGDVVVAVEGAAVISVGDLIGQLNRYTPGTEVELKLIRDGEEVLVPVILGEWPSQYAEGSPSRTFPRPDGGSSPENPRSP